MAFDPDAFIAKYDSQPAAEGTPPLLARPEAPGSTAGLPDYAHDPVPPAAAPQVRQVIAQVTSRPGFDRLPPDQQRQTILGSLKEFMASQNQPGSATDAFVRGAGAAVPLGKISRAALSSVPLVGNGSSFRENWDREATQDAASAAAHPVADIAGRTAGGLATVAATMGAGAPAAAPAASAGQAAARAAAPVAIASGTSGALSAADAAAEGKSPGEIAQRGLAGATVGAAAGTAIPVAAKVAAGFRELFKGAMGRSDERILAHVEDGTAPKLRQKVEQRADEVVAAVRARYGEEYKDPAAFVHKLDQDVSSVGNQTSHIYGEAEKVGGKLDPKVVAKAMAESRGQMGFAEQEIGKAFDAHTQKFSDRVPATRMTRDQVLEAARKGLQEGKSPGAIKGDMANGIPLDEARAEVTRLQNIAFDRLDTTITTPQRAAAGRAAGILKDALEAHVEAALPGQGHVVRELNNQQTILLRLQASAEAQAKTKSGTMAQLVEGAHVPHSATQAGIMAGKSAARGVDEAVASVGRKGADKVAGKIAEVAAEPHVQRLAQRLATIANPEESANALRDHIFGGAASGPPMEDIGPVEWGPKK